MKSRLRRWSLPVGMLLAVTLIAQSGAAQSSEGGPSLAHMALGGAFLLFVLTLGLGFYIYMSLALQTIADKTNTANSWLAWIPIANLFLMLDVARKPLWWFVLFLIPLVNLVMAVLVWMAIAEVRGKPNWWGILMIVPVANLVVPGVLAWGD